MTLPEIRKQLPKSNIKETEQIDPECIELCSAMNQFPGIETIESCCGHGKRSYKIWFIAQRLRNLPKLIYYFDGCHCGFYDWKVFVKTDCSMAPVHFLIEGPIGRKAYKQGKIIAQLLTQERKK